MNIPYRKFENFHILLWLIKDFCWVTGLKMAGMIMIVPTILVAIFITWLSRSILSELWHNLAVVCWISANSIWMIGEFYYEDTTRPYAIIFFVLGLGCFAWYYLLDTYRKVKERSRNT